MQIFEAIVIERERQNELKRQGKISATVADEEMTNLERLAVLAEEIGECAHKLNGGIGGPVNWALLRIELIQVSAIALAWCESDDFDKTAIFERVRSTLGVAGRHAENLASLIIFQGSLASEVLVNNRLMTTYTLNLLVKIIRQCVRWIEVGDAVAEA